MLEVYVAEYEFNGAQETMRVWAESLEEAYAMLDWTLPNEAGILDVYLEDAAYTG